MATNYRDYVINLVANQATAPLSVQGDYWQVINALSGLSLQFDNGASIAASQGQGGPQDYNNVTVTSAVTQTVTLRLGMTNGKTPYDSRLAPAAGSVQVNLSVSDQINPQPDVAVPATGTAVLMAANPARRALLVQLAVSAANGVRLGDATVGAAKGVQLDPGGTATLETTAAVSAYNPGAAAVTVTVTELASV